MVATRMQQTDIAATGPGRCTIVATIGGKFSFK